MTITLDEIRQWCRYLSDFHQAADSEGGYLITGCKSRRPSGNACGTCRHCQGQIIRRALDLGLGTFEEDEVRGGEINTAVFDYVKRVCPHMTDSISGPTDYRVSLPSDYAKILSWCASIARAASDRAGDTRGDDTRWVTGETRGLPCPRCNHEAGVHRTDVGCVFCDCQEGYRPPVDVLGADSAAQAAGLEATRALIVHQP